MTVGVASCWTEISGSFISYNGWT